MGEQIVLPGVRDASVGEKRLEAGYVGGQLLDSKPVSFAERAMPLDAPPVLIPGRAELVGELRPAGDQRLELRLGPEHRKGAVGVDVIRVDTNAAELAHRANLLPLEWPRVAERSSTASHSGSSSTRSSTGRSTPTSA